MTPGAGPWAGPERWAANRAAVIDERDRLAALARRLRSTVTDDGVHDLGDAVSSAVLRSVFHLAHSVEQAVAEGVLGERPDLDSDGFVDRAAVTQTLGDLASPRPARRAWGLREFEAIIGELDGAVGLLSALAQPDRQVLVFDPSGSGSIVEVVGQLDTADHVAVVVPGMGTTVQHFDTGVADRARRLRSAAERRGGGLAVLAWFGYEAPRSLDLIDAADEDLATAGAARLAEFVHDLTQQRTDAHHSVVAHSYGSVVAGLAAHLHGLPVDDLVVLGSPGLGVARAGELRLKPGARLWALKARLDPVAAVAHLARGPVRLHGADPYGPEFGSTVIDLTERGHSSYLDDDEGLETVAAIVTGRHRVPG
jgi:hypothetical protein